jgi:hypothetical protein
MVARTLTEMRMSWVSVCQELFCLILCKVSNSSAPWISFLASSVFTEILALRYSIRMHTAPATVNTTFMPAVQKIFESYCSSVLGARAGISRNRERLKPKNVTMLNSSTALIICFHFPKYTTQQIFLILYASCIVCRPQIINQTLCTTLCIESLISYFSEAFRCPLTQSSGRFVQL